MVTKLQKTDEGVVVLLPEDVLTVLGLTDDAEVSVSVEAKQGQIIITPTSDMISGVDEEFVNQVSDFIDHYRPALEALAK